MIKEEQNWNWKIKDQCRATNIITLEGEISEASLFVQPTVHSTGTDDSVLLVQQHLQHKVRLHQATKQWGTCSKGDIYRLWELTLNILRKWLDPGIHFNEFNVIKNFIHLLHTFICCCYAFSSEISCEAWHKHLKQKTTPWNINGNSEKASTLNS